MYGIAVPVFDVFNDLHQDIYIRFASSGSWIPLRYYNYADRHLIAHVNRQFVNICFQQA